MEGQLISLYTILKTEACREMPRQFIEYMRDLKVISGIKVQYRLRWYWRYTPEEVIKIQSIWYFRKRGFTMKKAMELSQKAGQKRDQLTQLNQSGLFAENQ